MQAAIEALTNGVAPDPPRYLRWMAHDVAALSSLVDDLFLLARIEAGRLELCTREPIDLAEGDDDAVESPRPTAAAGIDVRLVADGPVRAMVNPAAIGRVVRNLLDNAIHQRATWVDRRGRGVQRRSSRRARHQHDQLRRFRGDGIRSVHQPSRNRANGGAGLGLTITAA